MIAVASLGDYRAEVVNELRREMGRDLVVYAGAPAYSPSIKLLNYDKAGVVQLENFYFGPDVLFQRLPIVHVLAARGLIMDLNPRVPHVWLITAIRRILGRRTMLWGHAWSRTGRDSFMRGLLRRVATGLVTYSEEQARALRLIHPGKPVIVAPNALYSQCQMSFTEKTDRFRILYVGRLVVEKKPELLLKAFAQVAQMRSNLILTFVGDGPQRRHLESQASSLGISSNVAFCGHVSEFESLRSLYAEAVVSVSPGYVGLSITQSFAFGVPMVISRDEVHSPEIEAARSGFNAVFFNSDDKSDLARTLLGVAIEATVWAERGEAIAEACRERYSSEKMAEGIVKALTSPL